ncbi:hypothetical protein [Riemerella columbipharyngis]|uniref:Uncharacterized protein n=1 Tax=Riemerella columbipharyngis TaxID=1071918 RepID=A0A1G6Y3I2_9FLAO|nr:hypothetical protein [Riemerella columbipharyngis]SDD84852.1 hypothetical protein SAMN05421544_10114 [Riemerella columbipharyngis]
MKFIIETILAVVIIFFVWNILKRVFFNVFYSNFPQNDNRKNNPNNTFGNKKPKKKVNWDAETIDYEEIKDDKNA